MITFLFLLSLFICLVLLILNNYLTTLLNNKSYRLLKQVYECGFTPYKVQRRLLARFYIVGILFLLFDLELSYFIVGIYIPLYTGFFTYNNIFLTIFILLIVLSFGMILEWYYNVINKTGFTNI